MSLDSGTRLGPYEIISLIGAGGMGEVYRARDPRLAREVAIKILPAQFSGQEERLRRFEQEARAAGMLSHPNILSVFDIGVQDSSVYVVTELLTGETLRERISGSPLPSRKAIEYALQVAHGLSAAHDKGIVHRDLKPENIYINRDGRVKILDFGLAKLIDSPSPVEERSKLATAELGTQPGMVLGTVGYMSPEQVRGRPADHRSDIFSFGAILYEMLTGQNAFRRDSVADTMSAILKEDPQELSGSNRNILPSLERIVRHCLEKNPEERFQSAHDLAFDLEMVSGISGTGAVPTTETPARPSNIFWKLAAAVLILAALAASFFIGKQTAANSSLHTSEPGVFKRLTFRRGYISAARFTPDGQSIVYSATWVGAPEELFVTRPQSPVSRSIGISNAALLSVSSAGEMAVLLNPIFTVGWQRIGTLAHVPIDGGAPRQILENVQDADWGPNGKDFAVARAGQGKYTLEFPIGKVLYQTTGWLNNLQVSPQGDAVAFMDHPAIGDDRGFVALVDLKGKVQRFSIEYASETGLHWSPDGKEIWYTASKEGSNEQPIYAVSREGKERTVAAMVGNLILHDIHPTGEILLTRDSRRREIIALPPGQTKERDLSWFDWSFCRDISADGKLLLFEEQGAGGGPNYSVFLRGTDGSAAVKLGDGFASSISLDGRFVLSNHPSDFTHYTILPTGAGQPQRKSIPDFTLSSGTASRWFNDGKRVLISGSKSQKPSRLWIHEIETNQIHPVTQEGVAAVGIISPNQEFILSAHQDWGFALYPVRGGEPEKVQGLEPGDALIRWTLNDAEVFVGRGRQIPAQIYSVNIQTGKRTLWKEILPLDPTGIAGQINMVITPDGQTYAYTYRRVLSDLYLASGLISPATGPGKQSSTSPDSK